VATSISLGDTRGPLFVGWSDANIGAPELLILLVLLAVFGACVFTVIDVARRGIRPKLATRS